MIKYLGSKRTLIPTILEAVGSIARTGTVLDLFSGTSRVGHALKRANYRVLANDHNAYAHTLATCYVQSDAERLLTEATELVSELNAVPAKVPVSRGVLAPVLSSHSPRRTPMLLAPKGQRNVATGGVGASPTEPVVETLSFSSPRRGEGIAPSPIRVPFQHDRLLRPSGATPQQSIQPRVQLEDSLHPWPPSKAPPGPKTIEAFVGDGTLADHFTQTYCLNSRFFHPKNGPRIHAIRERIASLHLPRELESVALVSLMEAADRVDSTTGVQMAYLKQWAPRAHNDLALRVPDILPQATSGKGAAFCMDALEAMRELSPVADIVYLDPPYNQHSYLGNYHIWETLIRWDAPEVYGVACKRTDCRERKSAFNSKRLMKDSLAEVLDACRAPAMVVSFSDEGYLTRAELEAMLSPRGRIRIIERDYKRYVGAQIGIYNPSGERVGKISHLRNTEMLFVVTPRKSSREPGRPRPGSTTATVRPRPKAPRLTPA